MDSPVREKSIAFAIRIVRMAQHLQDAHEYILSKQIIRSGTSIGANIAEAQAGISMADFSAKMGIAYKECRETLYWLEILHKTDYLTQAQYDSLQADADELAKLLYSILRSSGRK